MRYFNFPEINKDYHSSMTSKPTSKGALLDLFENREGHGEEFIEGVYLGHRAHKIVEFKISDTMRKEVRRFATLDS